MQKILYKMFNNVEHGEITDSYRDRIYLEETDKQGNTICVCTTPIDDRKDFSGEVFEYEKTLKRPGNNVVINITLENYNEEIKDVFERERIECRGVMYFELKASNNFISKTNIDSYKETVDYLISMSKALKFETNEVAVQLTKVLETAVDVILEEIRRINTIHKNRLI